MIVTGAMTPHNATVASDPGKPGLVTPGVSSLCRDQRRPRGKSTQAKLCEEKASRRCGTRNWRNQILCAHGELSVLSRCGPGRGHWSGRGVHVEARSELDGRTAAYRSDPSQKSSFPLIGRIGRTVCSCVIRDRRTARARHAQPRHAQDGIKLLGKGHLPVSHRLPRSTESKGRDRAPSI